MASEGHHLPRDTPLNVLCRPSKCFEGLWQRGAQENHSKKYQGILVGQHFNGRPSYGQAHLQRSLVSQIIFLYLWSFSRSHEVQLSLAKCYMPWQILSFMSSLEGWVPKSSLPGSRGSPSSESCCHSSDT